MHFPHQKRERCSYQTLNFRCRAPTFAGPQSFIFLSLGILKIHSVLSCNCKRNGTWANHFYCLSDHSEPPRGFWKGAAVSDQTYRYQWLRWFSWWIFWAFVVICALVKLRNLKLLNSELVWHSEDRASWYILIIKANELHYFSNLFDKVLYMPVPVAARSKA